MIEQRANYDVIGKIGLVDADLLDNGTRHPNLVIMKLSGYFKEKGCDVELIEDYSTITADNYKGIKDYDAIYISKVFDFSKIDEKILEFENVYFGGTGFFFDGGMDLPCEIEHHMPDYHIYEKYIEHDTKHENKSVYWKDYTDYSIGFATRGCFRKCEFCVNRKYDRVFFHSHISEWVDPKRKGIYLWDDNIFGYPKWKEVFDELKEINKPFQFRQGLDIRLLTEEKAVVLDSAKYKGDIIFAFDHIEDKELIEEKLKLWRKHSDKSTKLYVLSGFDGQDEIEVESVFERISIIIKYGCLPYIMRHKNYEKSPYKGLFIQIARWCNMPQFLKKMTFREFCEANQAYHKTEGTLCSSMIALNDFEDEFPDIAKKYFDIRFDEQEYVRKLKVKREAEKKAKEKKSKREEKQRGKIMNYIDKLLKQDIYPNEIINEFYLSPVSTDVLEQYSEEKLELATDRLIMVLNNAKIEDIITVIEANRNKISEITPSNIPQFSNIDSINEVLDYVLSSGDTTYELIGYYINKDAKKGAQTKYGENHYKTAASIGLTTIEKPFRVTMLGKKYMMLSIKEKISLRNKLFLLVPIVQHIVIEAKYKKIQPMDILRLYLSESTSVRRRSNVRTMVEYVYKEAEREFIIEIQKNLDWK